VKKKELATKKKKKLRLQANRDQAGREGNYVASKWFGKTDQWGRIPSSRTGEKKVKKVLDIP